MNVVMRPWFPPDPLVAFGALAGCTAVAGILEMMARRRRKRHLRRLAGRWRMTFSSRDRLRIRAKVADRLPIPGAADVHVADVIYGSEGGKYRYIFTAEYTVGVVRTKRRQVRVAAFSEARDRQGTHAPDPVVLAPEGLSIVEQYQKLAPETAGRLNPTNM
jgi:hypothetical protein